MLIKSKSTRRKHNYNFLEIGLNVLLFINHSVSGPNSKYFLVESMKVAVFL